MSKKSKQDNLENMRHSCAHLLAAAVLELWPDTKLGIGPAIEDGFYYDFEFAKPISEKDLPKIERKMAELKKGWNKFERHELSVKKAKELMAGQPHKLELIAELAEASDIISFYQSGDFIDLCKGGHVKKASAIGAFKLLSVAGAYWRGDEKNKMLTRIYGTVFPTQKELDEYLQMQKEAKKRDHRKIGKELELFTFADKVGPGLPLWMPNGTVVLEELEKWAKETEKEWGYRRVETPHVGRRVLYETSSHLPYYEESMYPPMRLSEKEEGESEYFLKAMNCPHHHLIYAARPRSYRELPLRLAEYGMTYRYEQSGELHGLMRVRAFCVNDAHIYCTKEQAKDEFIKVLELHDYYYKTLGIKDYYIELGLRDPENKDKYHGNEDMWRDSERISKQAMEEHGIEYVEEEGSAAFYGPKADYQIRAVTGKIFTASTNQIDLYMPERFKLKYIGKDGNEHVPVIIHRAPLGSHERFIGFLIEHFAGAFPVWLHPVQAKVLPVSDRFIGYAEKVRSEIRGQKSDIRVKLDNSDETLGNKIRKAQEEKVPYMLIVGTKEEKNKSVNLRLRNEEEIGEIRPEVFAGQVAKIVSSRSLSLWK